MRKHLFSILFLMLAAAIWWVSFSPTFHRPTADDNNPIVVVSGFVPYTIAKQLAGNTVNLHMLLSPGVEPHSFEPTPGVFVSLKNADAFIYVSNELEPWAMDLTQVVSEKTPVIQLARELPAGEDPHIWMNFTNVKLIAKQIAEVLMQINPNQRVVYLNNLKKFEDEINVLAEQFSKGFSDCKSREVVHIGHLAFKNLTDEFDLQLIALAGSTHNAEHAAKKLVELIKQMKEKHVTSLFTEETLPTRLAQMVAQETGAQILLLYPIEHISKQDFNQGVTYAELMRRNLVNLQRGLGCKVY